MKNLGTDNPEVTAYMIDDEGKAASYPDKNDAQKIIDSLTGEAEVLSFDKTTKKTQPDQLYKLTDIQVEAGSKYGYTPEKTLELIQSLYEKHKLISYPRTGGRYVSTEKSKDFARAAEGSGSNAWPYGYSKSHYPGRH